MSELNECQNCAGTGWTCENHPDHAWSGMTAVERSCGCGAGAPCGACNLELASAGHIERERQRMIDHLKALPASYSGWNPHDEPYDDGANAMLAQIIEIFEKRSDR